MTFSLPNRILKTQLAGVLITVAMILNALPVSVANARKLQSEPAAAQAASLAFSNTTYFTTENAGHFDVTVNRTADTSGTATVEYATVDSDATQKQDYEIALGKLAFNPGETSKTFRVLIVDNNEIGGGSSHDLKLVLSNPTGATLGNPSEARLFISDNEGDTPGQPPNIIDDPQYFVRQHYFDFLNREPDQAGLDFWTSQITSCGGLQLCVERKRINVSAAFFLSLEFQRTAAIAYIAERAAFGGLPRYIPFMRDIQALQKGYIFGPPQTEAILETNKQAFFDELVTRPEFTAKYATLSNQDYVSALFANAPLNTTTGELYVAQLKSAEQVPASNSPAKGLLILRQAKTGLSVSISLYLSGLTSAETAAHLHGPAAPGSTGPAIVTLPSGSFVNFETPLTLSQFRDLSGGHLYVDVHTANFPDGEIRGQIPSNAFVIAMITRSLDDGIINRAQALRLVAETDFLNQLELNRMFVLMEYFGYLRRNPDESPDSNLDGFNYWLNKLNAANGNYIEAEMVKAFISSDEYRRRFRAP